MNDQPSAITDLRTALAGDLTEINCAVSWPDVLAPPGAFLAPPLAADFITAGPNFGEWTVALDLVLYVDHGDPSERLAELESMLQYALINTADWELTGVDPPAPAQINDDGAEYLTCVIHLSKPTRMGA